MWMRIVWGRITPGQWDDFQAAFEKAAKMTSTAKGLKDRWLVQDQTDKDAGYSITLWENEQDMKAFWNSKSRSEAMDLLRPYFRNQYTVTDCEVKFHQTSSS